MYLEEEEWRDIKGFEGLYQVSNLGNVRSLDRWVVDKIGRKRLFEGKMLTSRLTIWGYLSVGLGISHTRIVKNHPIHRLVAEAFIPNPNNHPCVNHKDEDKTNNRVDNLEWCTYQYNINYGTCIERRSKKKKKKVNQYTKDGVFIKQWDSPKDAADYLGISAFHIYSVCSGKRKKAGGYIWRYA